MRKFKLFFLLILFSGFFSLAPVARTETIRNTGQSDSRSRGSGDPLAPFLGNPGRSVSAANAPSVSDPLEAVLPAGSGHQEVSAESKLGWALWEMTQKTGDAAKAVKDTVKTTITDYVKDKQKQSRQQDLVEKFYTNLQYVSSNLHLAPHDQQDLTTRVQRVYIEDAESGRYELDSLHFRELPYIVRKEYADMVLARTENGEAETYHLNGTLKTRWQLKEGQPDGPIVTYYENGEINFIDVFKDGRKIRRTKYDTEGKLVFEQNYEYSLPEENVLNPQEQKPSKKETASIKQDERLQDPQLSERQSLAAGADTVQESPEPSKDDAVSGLVELPPQVSPNRIEV